MNWLVLTVFAGVLAATARVSHRYLLSDAADPTAYTIVYQFAATAFVLPFALNDLRNYVFVSEHSLQYLALLASTVCWMAFNWFSFHADRHAEVSITSVLSRTRAIWSVFLGALLFSESVTLLRVAGAILIVVGAGLLTRSSNLRANRGVILALSAAFAASIALAIDKFAASQVPAGIVAASGFLGGGIVLSFKTNGAYARVRELFRTRARYGVLSALLGGWSYWFLVKALASGDIGQVVPVYQGYLVLVVLAGILLLREHTDLKYKLLAAGVVLMGATLVNIG